MEVQLLLRLGDEAHSAVVMLTEALTRDCPGCVTALSEGNRRAMSILCELQAHLFSSFLPSLPRAGCEQLGSALTEIVFAAFAAAQILPPQTCVYSSSDRAGLESLCTMSAHIHDGIATLPRYAKGKHSSTPDTFRYLSERNKWMAARTIAKLHGGEQFLSAALDRLAHALDQGRAEMMRVMMESV